MDTPGGASLEGGAPVAVLQPISDYYTYSCIYEFSRILLSLVLIPYHRVIPTHLGDRVDSTPSWPLQLVVPVLSLFLVLNHYHPTNASLVTNVLHADDKASRLPTTPANTLEQSPTVKSDDCDLYQPHRHLKPAQPTVKPLHPISRTRPLPLRNFPRPRHSHQPLRTHHYHLYIFQHNPYTLHPPHSAHNITPTPTPTCPTSNHSKATTPERRTPRRGYVVSRAQNSSMTPTINPVYTPSANI